MFAYISFIYFFLKDHKKEIKKKAREFQAFRTGNIDKLFRDTQKEFSKKMNREPLQEPAQDDEEKLYDLAANDIGQDLDKSEKHDILLEDIMGLGLQFKSAMDQRRHTQKVHSFFDDDVNDVYNELKKQLYLEYVCNDVADPKEIQQRTKACFEKLKTDKEEDN